MDMRLSSTNSSRFDSWFDDKMRLPGDRGILESSYIISNIRLPPTSNCPQQLLELLYRPTLVAITSILFTLGTPNS